MKVRLFIFLFLILAYFSHQFQSLVHEMPSSGSESYALYSIIGNFILSKVFLSSTVMNHDLAPRFDSISGRNLCVSTVLPHPTHTVLSISQYTGFERRWHFRKKMSRHLLASPESYAWAICLAILLSLSSCFFDRYVGFRRVN